MGNIDEGLRVILQPKRRVFVDFVDKIGGQYNGYLVISDKDHPWYGKDEYALNHIDVHRGVTYARYVDEDVVNLFGGLTKSDICSWMVGFDTFHDGDTEEYWTEERVREHTELKLLAEAIRVRG